MTDIVVRPTRLADGRELIYFDDAGSTLPPERRADPRHLDPRPPTATMRLDLLTGDWVSIAAARQNRAFLPPAEFDPLAPQSATNPSEVPSQYDVAVFENRSPSFGPALGDVENAPEGLEDLAVLAVGRTRTSVGRTEVVCFDPGTHGSFADLSANRARTVVGAWAQRTAALSALDGVQQVFPFENRGEAIGVTLHHPHGQIYAYPYVTPRTLSLLRQVDAYDGDLFADLLDFERSGDRVVLESETFTAFVPFAARWPVELHLLPN
ncbi:MAG: galactose-1-phosphate uridylyltransferase, partial [Aeromicrobium sp.]